MLLLTFRLFHILFMAVWVGAMLFVAGDAKRSLAEPSTNLPLMRSRISRCTKLAAGSGMLTLLSGFGLIFVVGGFGAVPVPVHISMTTTFAMLVTGGMLGRTWRSIEADLDNGVEATTLVPRAKRMSMFAGIFHMLWLVTLILMVFRHSLM